MCNSFGVDKITRKFIFYNKKQKKTFFLFFILYFYQNFYIIDKLITK